MSHRVEEVAVEEVAELEVWLKGVVARGLHEGEEEDVHRMCLLWPMPSLHLLGRHLLHRHRHLFRLLHLPSHRRCQPLLQSHVAQESSLLTSCRATSALITSASIRGPTRCLPTSC